MDFINVKNNERIAAGSIPEVSNRIFTDTLDGLMGSENAHCVNYFGYRAGDKIKLICAIADDNNNNISLTSTQVTIQDQLPSLTPKHTALHIFERTIHENFGIHFSGHPWLKPVRYPSDRHDKRLTIPNYPFYSIDSEELHEVGVGPIHAGIIEPGHFRFICNGEQIMHLEIQLGFQHRGIENLFLTKKGLLQRATLAENITGDTTVGHAMAFANAWEGLCGFVPSEKLEAERIIALENERIAIHTGDLSAICTDIAFQLGSAVFGRLRTPVINFFQQWCGNRFAKSLIRPGKSNFRFTDVTAKTWTGMIDSFMPDFIDMANKTFDLPSVLARLERTGIVSKETARDIGAVGMAAKASGLQRDVRFSHPFGYYHNYKLDLIKQHTGDVYSRAKLRFEEVLESAGFIKDIVSRLPQMKDETGTLGPPEKDSFIVSLVEGWRGEICHCAITGNDGELIHYSIKDPSVHNWMALALAVRQNEISDFPVCNKSFNLSYCGHDL